MQQDVAQEAPIGVDSNHQLMAGDAGQWESLQGIHSNGGTAELPAQEEGQHADNWLGAEDGIDHLSEGQDPFVGGDAEETPHVTEGDEHSQEEKSASGEGDLKPIETSKESNNVRKTSTSTAPEPFRFSMDKRPRRMSDGAVQTTPEPGGRRRLRSPSHTAPPAKPASPSRPKAQTMPQPFNLQGLKLHEKAVEQLKADIAAKEAEESAPRTFRARPILRPETAPASRVVAAPTKPSAFKLSVEERAGRRDKFKKQLEERGQVLENEREKIVQDIKKELEKETKQVRRSATFKAAPAKFTPDDKVFKPKLGQSPTTTPRAPVLGRSRRHSTGSQDSDASHTKTADAAPMPAKPPSPARTKPAASQASKAPTSKVQSTSSTTPPGPTKSTPTKAAPLSKPRTVASPKPAPPKLATKAPSSPQTKSIHPSASTPSSPRPVAPKGNTRRNSVSGGPAAKPSSPRGAAPTRPISARSTASPETTKPAAKPRPPSAAKPSMPSPRLQALSSPKGPVRPKSANAPDTLKTPPRKTLPPRGATKATANGSKQAGGANENGKGEVQEVTTSKVAEQSSKPAEASAEVAPAPDEDAHTTVLLPDRIGEEEKTGSQETTAEATPGAQVQANGVSHEVLL